MLERPLHHCYLVPANTATACVSAVEKSLQKLLSDADTELIVDADVIETLTVEMARQLRERGQQKAVGQARCIIRGFDTATTEAQNALLKIIESPAEGTHFFFVTPEPDHLLETVRSRVWRLDEVCAGKEAEADILKLVDDFLAADDLPARLQLMENLDTTQKIRLFAKEMASRQLPRRSADFGKALEEVADWSRDTGASAKLLGQYLAVAAGDSPDHN